MDELQIEFPIVRVFIVQGRPADTILFQTNMLPTHNDDDDVPQLPLLMMTLPEGTAEDYVKNKLGIPADYIEMTNHVPQTDTDNR